MYDVIYSKQAEKFIDKLPKIKQKHILAVIERSRIRPEAHFERLVGVKAYKLRAGDYRIIADLKHEELNILVIEIGHRRNVYK